MKLFYVFAMFIGLALQTTIAYTDSLPDPCDRKLLSSKGNSSFQDDDAYQKRTPNRCEGVFQGNLTTEGFKVVSLLTTEKPDYEKKRKRNIEITWFVPDEAIEDQADEEDEEIEDQAKSNVIHLQANDLYYNNYRMDSVENLEEKQFSWPTHHLKKYVPTAEKLGVVGWIKNADNDEIYLPLQVTQDLSDSEVTQDSSESKDSVTYVLGVKFSKDYRKITYDVRFENETIYYKTKKDYFSSDDVVFLSLKGFDKTPNGIYRVVISAYDEDGHSKGYSILLYHEGV